MPLSDVACKNAKCPEDKPRLRLTDFGGLYLEVVPTGGKLWRWKYRFAGKEKRLALGAYPHVTLAMARRARDDARDMLKGGKDPVQAKKTSKLAERIKLENNFEAIARLWWAHWKGTKTDRHSKYVMARLEADIFPEIGKLPIADIRAPDLIAAVKKIEDRGAGDLAKRAWQTCSQIFRHGITLGVTDRNPAADIKPSDALKPCEKKNYARVDAKEFPELLRAIEAYRGTPLTRLAMKLMALTFVRTGELIGARWEEFDLEEAMEWRIPAARMKMRTPHIVPLSRQAVEVLTTLKEMRGLSGLLFQGERDHETCMSNNTILQALKRMGYGRRMTGHGFRGIASTILHEQGYEHMHIELQLAHSERDAVSASYNWATYLEPRRVMMQAWADHLDQLRQGAKVIALRAA